MKKILLSGIVISALAITANKVNAQYIDLTTGKTITIVKNNANGIYYNPESQHQIFIYVDAATKDTLYGRTGEVINGKVSRTSNGHYVYKEIGCIPIVMENIA